MTTTALAMNDGEIPIILESSVEVDKLEIGNPYTIRRAGELTRFIYRGTKVKERVIPGSGNGLQEVPVEIARFEDDEIRVGGKKAIYEHQVHQESRGKVRIKTISPMKQFAINVEYE